MTGPTFVILKRKHPVVIMCWMSTCGMGAFFFRFLHFFLFLEKKKKWLLNFFNILYTVQLYIHVEKPYDEVSETLLKTKFEY